MDKKTTKEDDGETPAQSAEREGEVTYQILDSVEEETIDLQAPAGLPESCNGSDISASEGSKKTVTESAKVDMEEEEEPLYEILDSVEEDQEDSMVPQVPGEITKKHGNQDASIKPQETSKCPVTVEEQSKSAMILEETPGVVADPLKTFNENLARAKKNPLRTTQEVELDLPEGNVSSPLNFDRVSDEEDFPNDESEEEPLQRQVGKEWEKVRTKEEEFHSIDKGIRLRTRRQMEEEGEELVILDEEGADEPKEERGAASQSRKAEEEEIAEGEQQTLFTLDVFEEEEKNKKVEPSPVRNQPLCQQVESADSSNTVVHVPSSVEPPFSQFQYRSTNTDDFNVCFQTLLTSAEVDDQEKVAAEKTTTKRKHSDDSGVLFCLFHWFACKCSVVGATLHQKTQRLYLFCEKHITRHDFYLLL